MEVTLTSTLRKQSSSLMVSCLLPIESWERRAFSWALPADAEHILSSRNTGTPIPHWERGRGGGSVCTVGLFLFTEHGDGAASEAELV